MSRQTAGFNHNLHGLRGLAALAVFVCHCYTVPRDYGLWSAQLPVWLGEGLHLGRYGVEIFFLISGYLITESLRRKGNIRVFLIERCIRLQPAYLGVLVPLFIVKPLLSADFLDGASPLMLPLHFLANLFFIAGVFPLPLALGVSWTLSFEAVFYLTASAAFVLARRSAGVVAASFCVMMGLVMAVLYPGVVFFFVGAGVYLYRDVLRTWLAGFHWPLLALLVWMLQWPTLLWPYAESHRVTVTGMLLLVGSLIASLLFFAPTVDGRGVLAALLRGRVFQYLGNISYSFYLWHCPVMVAVLMVLRKLLHGDADRLVILLPLLTLPLAIVIADLSWRIIEQRIGQWLRRRLLPPTAAVA